MLEQTPSMRIFISHSIKDKEIAELLTNLMTSSLRVNPDNIFCSSLDGHKNSPGDDWRKSVQDQLNNAEVIFLLFTNNYRKSEVCLAELGAAYFQAKAKLIPLLESKSTIPDVGILLETKQYEFLTESGSLERIKDVIARDTIKGDYWDRNKQKFLNEISSLLGSKGAPDDTFDPDDKLRRGFYSDFIADAVFSHHDKTSNIELIKQLYSELRSKNERTVDLKYNYLGATSAANWVNLSQHPSYGHSKLINFFGANSEDIISSLNLSDNEKIDYISLGSGDGAIDKYILLQLLSHDNLNVFYPFDISFELLQKVVNEVSTCNWWPAEKLKIKAIHGDFLELFHYKKVFDHNATPNLFSLLGFTFGNYNEAEFIGKIKEGMRKNDFLLIDARLHDLTIGDRITAEDRNKIISNYNNESTNKFVFGALETVTNADYTSVSFECVPTQEITNVPNAINILIYCKGINAKFRSDNKGFKKDKICLGLTTLYCFDDLKTWLARRGFQIIWSKSVSGNGFILLKKMV